jgi:putative phosphoesterase
VRDAEHIQAAFKNIKVECVAGNNDFFGNYPEEKVINFDNKKLLLTHGHEYRVNHSYDGLIKKGKELKIDGVLFGHTHAAHEQIIDNILCFNPGSISLPVRNPSYGIIETKGDKLYSMICRL